MVWLQVSLEGLAILLLGGGSKNFLKQNGNQVEREDPHHSPITFGFFVRSHLKAEIDNNTNDNKQKNNNLIINDPFFLSKATIITTNHSKKERNIKLITNYSSFIFFIYSFIHSFIYLFIYNTFLFLSPYKKVKNYHFPKRFSFSAPKTTPPPFRFPRAQRLTSHHSRKETLGKAFREASERSGFGTFWSSKKRSWRWCLKRFFIGFLSFIGVYRFFKGFYRVL